MKALLVILTSISFLTSAYADPKFDAAQKDYIAAGNELMSLINSKDKDIKTKAPALVKKMGDQAVVVIGLIAAKEKGAEKMLKFVIANRGQIEKASFSSLEKDWHDGAEIKKGTGFDLAKEENEKFTDPVHILVHPYLTLRAIEGNEGKTLAEAKEELAEGIEQMNSAKKML